MIQKTIQQTIQPNFWAIFSMMFILLCIASYSYAAMLLPNVFIVWDDGTLIRSGYSASDYGQIDISGEVDKEKVIKKFFQDRPDAKSLYDFIILATTFKPGDNIGQFTATKKAIRGTGDSHDDINLVNTYLNAGLSGEEKFQGYAFVMNIDDMSDDLYLPIHEMSHRWLFRLGDYDSCGKGFGCTRETGFKVNKNGAHYNDRINTITKEGGKSYKDPNGGSSLQSSVQPGYCLDFGDGGDGYRFTSLSLYLMGLIPADQVVPLNWHLTTGSWSDKGILCSEKTFSVQDVINLVGPRDPAYPNTQRNFSVAYVLLTKQGQVPTETQINKMNFIAENFPKKWADATGYTSIISDNIVVVPVTNTSVLTPSQVSTSKPSLQADQEQRLTKNLQLGRRDKEVTILQKKLQSLGYFPYSVQPTGYFGPFTKKSVQSFQIAKKLPATGFVGPLTRNLLNR